VVAEQETTTVASRSSGLHHGFVHDQAPFKKPLALRIVAV